MDVRRLLATEVPAATILIRLMVGAVFLSEGIQKFLFPEARGVGRFEGMGFPDPEFWASVVGVVEIVAGVLVLLGLLTRIGALLLAVDMVVAIVTTKIPILLGRDLGPFQVRDLDTYGFWSMAHEARTDWAMLLGSLFLLGVGAGVWSVDAAIRRRMRRRSARSAIRLPAGDRPVLFGL
ncbi:MAG: DoxX family protein [Gemmatimonadota bacterium]